MPRSKSVTTAEIQEAAKALGLDIPIRSARRLSDGSIELTTRAGTHVYRKPRSERVPTRRKRRTK